MQEDTLKVLGDAARVKRTAREEEDEERQQRLIEEQVQKHAIVHNCKIGLYLTRCSLIACLHSTVVMSTASL